MRWSSFEGSGIEKESVILAPAPVDPRFFTNVVTDCGAHADRLAEAQRLRGRIAVDEGAIDASQLHADGRHVQSADECSWHLLTLDVYGSVAACARYLAHRNNAEFEELTISRTSLAQSETWGQPLREAVEADLRQAQQRGCSYFELGGWVITEKLRWTAEALRMVATTYAVGQWIGGGLGITTASTRSCSAAILKRVGGQRLQHAGVELPSYFDDQYHCQMEILRFDSSRPHPTYQKWIDAFRARVKDIPVICRRSAASKDDVIFHRHPAAPLAAIPGLA